MQKMDTSLVPIKLSSEENEVLSHLDEVVSDIAKQLSVEILGRNLEINSDADDWWYSRVIVVNCDAMKTRGLNDLFIDRLIKESYTNDIESKLIFRFKSSSDNKRSNRKGNIA